MNKTILLGLAIAASVSSASAYHADKYDGQFGMSLEGAYGIATKDAMPNVAGGNLSIFNYIETGSIVHQISLNGGILAGSHHPSVQDLGISGPYTASLRSTSDDGRLHAEPSHRRLYHVLSGRQSRRHLW